MAAGLAPWPMGVGRLDAIYDVDGLTRTMGWWYLDPAGAGATSADVEATLDDFYIQCAGHLASMLSAAAVLTACSATVRSPFYASARVEVERVSGVWSGAQAINSTCGLHWLGQTSGQGTQSVTHLVSCPDAFIDSTWRVSAVGYANLRDHGADFLGAFNTVTNNRGGSILHGCLHRWRNGAPLVVPNFDITVGLQPSPRVLTMRRRLPKGWQVQSS